MADRLAERLLRGFFRVDDPLLVSRYRAALESIGVSPGERSGFHVDAAGYSPELALELGDPYYLGIGVPRASAVILSLGQLAAPLVHPGLGYAADAYRDVTSVATREIGSITLREALIAEFQHPSAQLAGARELADLRDFEIHFRTPGGLVRGVQRLEAMKAEFLESNRRWLDDDFIGELAELAREVRDLGQLSERFVASKHSLGPFYSAAFGGSYVLEEPGQSRSQATTFVLASAMGSEPSGEDAEHRSARGRRVILGPLDAGSAVDLLVSHGIARIDAATLRRDPDAVAAIQHWIGVDHLLSRDPERPLDTAGPREVARLLQGDPEVPPAYREIDEVRRRLGARGRLDPDALSPATKLRLLTPSATRETIRRFVRHVQATADTLHLERTWRDAPDVFFARLPALSERRRAYFVRWLEAEPRR